MATAKKSLNNFKNALTSDYEHFAHLSTDILHFVKSKHKFQHKTVFHPLFQENITFLAQLRCCIDYRLTQIHRWIV